ncbi:hypothetical protein BDD43_2061 [Mucilaginibacter gracilis]|uniref:Probable sensor domain-containing protein n=1 Tax=Mucilaginibacter gracilis TaxID=423350 RepID=A0A495IYV5_9SPHI|nr:hypothetical protein [Mucilaginibacter gracilis]RKR81900.1 hypothetical protein BDD43_2061 [Mucilaginibacter gracilis]
MSEFKTPNDLAAFVFSELNRSKIQDAKPSEEILREIFNTLYYTSLQTEEGQFIKVTVTLLDHNSTAKGKVLAYDDWAFYPFKPAIEFTVKNLVKLSKAADPWSSSLAVYYNDQGELFINGMIDQTIHYQSFLNYEREEKPAHPGIFQTMINGIGILNVMLDYQPIASLNQNSLVKHYPNVFGIGPISEYLKRNIQYNHSFFEELIEEKLSESDVDICNRLVLDYTIQSISRILLKIKNYHHGGAVLITKDFKKDLNVKYQLGYDRIEQAIMHILKAITDEEFLDDEVRNLRRAGSDMPIKLHRDYLATEDEIDESYNELIGAIRFTSSLSCVDGLVLMSPNLKVKGFGTVITEKEQPPYIRVNKNATPGTRITKISPSHFGTRHQSMFAYCYKHPDSLGFVVSQDGEIRAIKCVEGEVMMWENIKVYQFIKSNKMPKLPLPPKPPRK